MRRTVATLLVVASPLLVAVPVGASDGPAPGKAAPPAVAPAGVVPVVGVPVAGVPVAGVPVSGVPVVGVPGAAAPPAVMAPGTPALPAAAAVGRVTAVAAAPVRPAARTLRPATLRARDLDDAGYAARLQAELCLARTIFCGLDRNGRYPAH